MKLTTIALAVLRLQYRIARTPLRVIDRQLAIRLVPEAPARQLFERSLGVLDVVVGRALGDQQLARRGDVLAERSEPLDLAEPIEATVDTDTPPPSPPAG